MFSHSLRLTFLDIFLLNWYGFNFLIVKVHLTGRKILFTSFQYTKI